MQKFSVWKMKAVLGGAENYASRGHSAGAQNPPVSSFKTTEREY